MPDERAQRRSTYQDGPSIRLADGRRWTLPSISSQAADPALADALRVIRECEDQAEGLRAELALTILLLSRNYELSPGDFQHVLTFQPDDPALAELQQTVHRIVCDALETHELTPVRESRPQHGPSRRWWGLHARSAPPGHRASWSLRSR